MRAEVSTQQNAKNGQNLARLIRIRRDEWLTNTVFELPAPVSLNAGYSRGGRNVYLTSRARNFKRSVIECCHRARAERKLKLEPFCGDLEVLLVISDRLDADNSVKFLLDALQDALLFKNDKSVKILTVLKDENLEKNKCFFYIREIDAD